MDEKQLEQELAGKPAEGELSDEALDGVAGGRELYFFDRPDSGGQPVLKSGQRVKIRATNEKGTIKRYYGYSFVEYDDEDFPCYLIAVDGKNSREMILFEGGFEILAPDLGKEPYCRYRT